MILRRRNAWCTALESYVVSLQDALGRRRGRPGRPAVTGGMLSTRVRVWVMSLTLAAVVVTCSGVSLPSRVGRCLLPVFRRSAGEGPVATPPLSRGRGSRPRTHQSSRVRRPCSARRSGGGAVSREPRSDATGQAPPTGLTEAETRVQGQQLPGDIVVENVQDALQALSVVHRPRPLRPLVRGRQQRFHACPQVVVRDLQPSSHTPRTAWSLLRSRPTSLNGQVPVTSS